MDLFRCVLVVVDDSDAATSAVIVAARLSQGYGAQLIVCHAVNWLPIASNTASTKEMIEVDGIRNAMKAPGNALLGRGAALLNALAAIRNSDCWRANRRQTFWILPSASNAV